MKRLVRPREIEALVAQALQVKAALLAGSPRLVRDAASQLAADLGRPVDWDEAADTLAQSIACAALIIAAAGEAAAAALDWLAAQLAPWQAHALTQARALAAEPLSRGLAAVPARSHLYEPFLHRYARDRRQRRGVFFTPQPVADYLVAAVDRRLRDEFSLAEGLADEAVQIIDPACGTGVFPLAVIDRLHQTHLARSQLAGTSPGAAASEWNACIRRLLPRCVGIEILPAAGFLAKLNLALKLVQTGFDLQAHGPIQLIVADALAPSVQSTIRPPPSANPKRRFPVLLGNPPFSSLSTTTNPWIARLVRGDDTVRGYIRAQGQRLGERKTWLHDDYVKFLRLAQWHVEEAGAGIVGFVTNHGFLDNATFRLLRSELLRVFPRIEILDLHGNRKKGERSPDGSRDENVFGLDQGVAISVLSRPPVMGKGTGDRGQGAEDSNAEAKDGESENQMAAYRGNVNYAELWGPAARKLEMLAGPLSAVPLFPSAPDFQLVPHSGARRHAEYDCGWSLADAMPVNTTAPVTARDHFVVAFTAGELQARIEQFRDLSIPDDEIRRRYFQRTRSARYQPGDTRGWKLSAARRTVAADCDWQQKIVRCLYRPFDWRYVFWHPAMIDWPRDEVTGAIVAKDGGTLQVSSFTSDAAPSNLEPATCNWCLIARRQQLPTQPCTFFWIADCLALDGVIRSDNRGSESLFPVYVRCRRLMAHPRLAKRAGDAQRVFWNAEIDSPPTELCANFAPTCVGAFHVATGLRWQPLGRGDLAATFGPEDLAAYIYALFHSPTYRERYADELRRDFPRILIPRGAALYRQLCRLGERLVALHLLTASQIPPVFPPAGPLAGAIADFRVGGYVALRKWLQPGHRSPTDPEFARIAAAIGQTLALLPTIDEAVAAHGGWATAFWGQGQGMGGAGRRTGGRPPRSTHHKPLTTHNSPPTNDK